MELRGVLRKSKFPTKNKQPTLYGEAEIKGVKYKLKGWERTGTNGDPWISICFELPEDASKKGRSTYYDDFNDDIPF